MKTHVTFFLEALLALMVGAALVHAGEPFHAGACLPHYNVGHGVTVPYGDFGHGHGFGYGFGYHAATAGESYLRGFGFAARSVGEMNALNSVAVRNLEEARTIELENDLQETENFFAKRQANAAFHREQARPTLSQEQLNGMAQKMAPDRLTTQQYSAFGSLRWPAVLSGDEYSEYRETLNELFRLRTATGDAAGSEICSQVEEVAAALRAELNEQVRELKPMDFIAAKKFVDSLAYEARFAPLPAGVAAN